MEEKEKKEEKMLRKGRKDNRKRKKTISIDDIVPQKHILRDIEAAIDFSFSYTTRYVDCIAKKMDARR